MFNNPHTRTNSTAKLVPALKKPATFPGRAIFACGFIIGGQEADELILLYITAGEFAQPILQVALCSQHMIFHPCTLSQNSDYSQKYVYTLVNILSMRTRG